LDVHFPVIRQPPRSDSYCSSPFPNFLCQHLQGPDCADLGSPLFRSRSRRELNRCCTEKVSYVLLQVKVDLFFPCENVIILLPFPSQPTTPHPSRWTPLSLSWLSLRLSLPFAQTIPKLPVLPPIRPRSTLSRRRLLKVTFPLPPTSRHSGVIDLSFGGLWSMKIILRPGHPVVSLIRPALYVSSEGRFSSRQSY